MIKTLLVLGVYETLQAIIRFLIKCFQKHKRSGLFEEHEVILGNAKEIKK